MTDEFKDGLNSQPLCLPTFGEKFFRQLTSVRRMFVRLLRKFVSSQVVLFVVSGGSGCMSMSSKIMKFGSPLVGWL